MAITDSRKRPREDLAVFAEVRLAGESASHDIRVRNLSLAGLMGEGNVAVSRGSSIEVGIRGIPPVMGQVAWVEGDRFGVAFLEELEPEQMRQVTP